MSGSGLGHRQESVLACLGGEHVCYRRESWYPGDGWAWSTHAETVAILVSLVNRGLAARTVEEARDAYGKPVPSRTMNVYRLTDAGRAEVRRLTEARELLREARLRARQPADPLAGITDPEQRRQAADRELAAGLEAAAAWYAGELDKLAREYTERRQGLKALHAERLAGEQVPS